MHRRETYTPPLNPLPDRSRFPRTRQPPQPLCPVSTGGRHTRKHGAEVGRFHQASNEYLRCQLAVGFLVASTAGENTTDSPRTITVAGTRAEWTFVAVTTKSTVHVSRNLLFPRVSTNAQRAIGVRAYQEIAQSTALRLTGRGDTSRAESQLWSIWYLGFPVELGEHLFHAPWNHASGISGSLPEHAVGLSCCTRRRPSDHGYAKERAVASRYVLPPDLLNSQRQNHAFRVPCALTRAGLSVGEAASVEPVDHVLDLWLGDSLSWGGGRP